MSASGERTDGASIADRARGAIGVWPGGISRRERRTLAIGVVIVAAALFLTYVAMPFARRWSVREATLDAREAQLARVRGLVAAESSLAAAVRLRESRVRADAPRPIDARTPALAAAALQTALQQAAAQSSVQVQRVDVAGEEGGASEGANAAEVPATMTAFGDVHGLTELLDALQHGRTLLEVTALSVQSTLGPRGEPLLQMTVSVRAPWTGAGSAR
ncbi:MAG: type II secretion system protein GspM [Gemmatirosa sp.]